MRSNLDLDEIIVVHVALTAVSEDPHLLVHFKPLIMQIHKRFEHDLAGPPTDEDMARMSSKVMSTFVLDTLRINRLRRELDEREYEEELERASKRMEMGLDILRREMFLWQNLKFLDSLPLGYGSSR